MTKSQKFLIEILEEDIVKSGAALISINIDLSVLKDRRTTQEGKDLEATDKKIEELTASIPHMEEQIEMLKVKLERVKSYGNSQTKNGG
jgi:predicted RNase H-like nuclease (RuvC/YqgF family)